MKNKKPSAGSRSPKPKINEDVSPIASPLTLTVLEVSTKAFSDTDITCDEYCETSIESSGYSEDRSKHTVDDSYSKLQIIVQKLRTDNELLKLQVLDKDKQLQESNSEVEHLHNGLKSLQSQFVQLEKENKKARHTLLELSENSDSIEVYQKRITELSEEVDRLNGVVELLENDKEQLIAEHKVSLESSLSDLEIFRNELSDTIAELNASYTQLARVEEAHQTELITLSEREQSQLKKIEQLKSQCDEGSDKAELYNEVERLQSRIEAVEKERDAFQAQNSALESKLGEERSLLQLELAQSRDSLNGVNEQLKSKTTTVEKLKKAYKQVAAEKAKLNEELSSIHITCATQVGQLSELKAQLENAAHDIETRVSQRTAELQEALNESEAAYSAKQAHLVENLKLSADDLQATTNELKNAQDETRLLGLELEQLKARCSEVKELDKITKELQQEVNRLQENKIQLEATIVSLRGELSSVNEELESLRDDRNMSLSSNDEQLNAVKCQLLVLIESQAALQEENSTVLTQITDLERRYSDAISDLDQCRQALKHAVEKAVATQTELDHQRKEFASCQSAYEETKTSHSTLKKKAGQLKSIYQQATNDLKSVREELEIVRNNSESMVQLTELEQAQRAAEQLRKEVTEVLQENEKLIMQLDAVDGTHQAELVVLKDTHERSVSDMHGQLSSARDLVGILQCEVSELSASLAENKSMVEELWKAKQQLDQLQADRDEKNGKHQQTESVVEKSAVDVCQSELEEVRQELMASLLDMSAFSQGLSQAHSQLMILKDLVNLKVNS